jgi:hypothetical protein
VVEENVIQLKAGEHVEQFPAQKAVVGLLEIQFVEPYQFPMKTVLIFQDKCVRISPPMRNAILFLILNGNVMM